MTNKPETAQRQDFDSPWKEALDVDFPEFLLFFFPEIHAAVDWERGHSFLDKEFQKIVREAERGRRHVDKLVQVFLINGGETWLLILPPELERSFTEEVSRIEEDEGMEYITSVERIGMERGLAQGLEQGVKQGSLEQARIMLLEVLSIRFGPVSSELTGRIGQIADHEVLQELHCAALRCADVQTFTTRLEASGGAENIAS